VVQPRIDFHGLWIAPPLKGEALPRISAEGLGVDLQLSGSVKVRGSVLAVDAVDAHRRRPRVRAARLRHLRLPRQWRGRDPGWGIHGGEPGLSRDRAQVQAGRSAQVLSSSTFRRTSSRSRSRPGSGPSTCARPASASASATRSPASALPTKRAPRRKLIRVLDDVSKRQGDLARFSAWSPDPEGDRFTLALRARCRPTRPRRPTTRRPKRRPRTPSCST
jgi:hypothetical protein